MNLQVKPNPWSCSITAFAMAIDRPVQELVDLIGHDGSEVVFKGYPEPTNRRGFHFQECIEACLHLGFAVTPIELFPVLQSTANSKGYFRSFNVYFGPEKDHSNWLR